MKGQNLVSCFPAINKYLAITIKNYVKTHAITKRCNDTKASIEYSNDINDIYRNIDKYDPNKKRKILIVLYDMLDLRDNKKLQPMVTKLLIRSRKIIIYLVFIMQSDFAVPKNIRLNHIHDFVKKILNKREFQQIAVNQSTDIDIKDFTNFRKNVKLQYNINREAAQLKALLSLPYYLSIKVK